MFCLEVTFTQVKVNPPANGGGIVAALHKTTQSDSERADPNFRQLSAVETVGSSGVSLHSESVLIRVHLWLRLGVLALKSPVRVAMQQDVRLFQAMGQHELLVGENRHGRPLFNQFALIQHQHP